MKRMRPNLLISLGLLFLSASIIAKRTFDIPDASCFIFLAAAMILELTGVILAVRTPEFKNSKIARSKRAIFSRLTGGRIGKD